MHGGVGGSLETHIPGRAGGGGWKGNREGKVKSYERSMANFLGIYIDGVQEVE